MFHEAIKYICIHRIKIEHKTLGIFIHFLVVLKKRFKNKKTKENPIKIIFYVI